MRGTTRTAGVNPTRKPGRRDALEMTAQPSTAITSSRVACIENTRSRPVTLSTRSTGRVVTTIVIAPPLRHAADPADEHAERCGIDERHLAEIDDETLHPESSSSRRHSLNCGAVKMSTSPVRTTTPRSSP